jgi:hypothetical protein
MALDWFDKLTLQQLDRCERRWDHAARRIRHATATSARPQILSQGDIMLSGVVMGGIDEQASLKVIDRGLINVQGLRQQAGRKLRLDELDGERTD